MSRLIKTETAGKDRTRLTRAVVAALRELARQKEIGGEARDLAAFIVLALESISQTIDPSVAAWEKRGYWVKADKFRMEWQWTKRLSEAMRKALLSEDWGTVAAISAEIAQKLNKINVSENHRMGTPWKGSWIRLKERV
jgi:hypothetical protein